MHIRLDNYASREDSDRAWDIFIPISKFANICEELVLYNQENKCYLRQPFSLLRAFAMKPLLVGLFTCRQHVIKQALTLATALNVKRLMCLGSHRRMLVCSSNGGWCTCPVYIVFSKLRSNKNKLYPVHSPRFCCYWHNSYLGTIISVISLHYLPIFYLSRPVPAVPFLRTVTILHVLKSILFQ